MLDVLFKKLPLHSAVESNLLSLKGIQERLDSYLLLNADQEAKIVKSSGRYCLVEIQGKSKESGVLGWLKRTSHEYTPAPYLAEYLSSYLKTKVAKTEKPIFYYENPKKTTSIFLEYVAKRQFKEAKGVFELKETVLRDRDLSGKTALIFACEKDDLEAIEFLYSLRGDLLLEELDSNGDTAFVAALKNKRINVVECLCRISGGKTLEKHDGFIKKAFVEACEKGDLKAIEFLYALKGEVLLEELDSNKDTVFVAAFKNKRIDVMECLFRVSGGKVLEKQNHFIKKAFVEACEKEDLKAIEFLYTISEGSVLDERNSRNQTMFIFACESELFNVVELLYRISKGRVLKQKGFYSNVTPIEHLYTKKNTKMLKHLIYNVCGPEILQEKISYNQNTLFIMACEEGDLEYVKTLYAMGGEKLLKDKNIYGTTPFIMACKKGHKDVVEYLYKQSKGSVLADKNKYNETPFNAACRHDHLEVVKYLYEATKGSVYKEADRILYDVVSGPKVKAFLASKRPAQSENRRNYSERNYHSHSHFSSGGFSSEARKALDLILGPGKVPKSQREIILAFRKKSLDMHPDKNPNNPEVGAKYMLVTQAFTNLQQTRDWDRLPKKAS